jgi:NitT/TauT family transport system ATP-binding protein
MPTDGAAMGFLRIDGASYTYPPDETVVDGVDWAIGQGAFHCLVGRSGCGKTTLLKLAAGLLPPSRGAVRIQDAPVTEPSPQVGFVFQNPTLLDWLTAMENVLLPVSLKRRPGTVDRDRAAELLALVGLAEYAGRHPRELSGGQQSRVAIARALVNEPLVLLMDEPFAALDAITREELQVDLLRLCAARRTTVLFVTHDIAEAVYLADRVAVMAKGRVRESLDIDLARPRAPDVRYGARFNALCRAARQAMDAA